MEAAEELHPGRFASELAGHVARDRFGPGRVVCGNRRGRRIEQDSIPLVARYQRLELVLARIHPGLGTVAGLEFGVSGVGEGARPPAERVEQAHPQPPCVASRSIAPPSIAIRRCSA